MSSRVLGGVVNEETGRRDQKEGEGMKTSSLINPGGAEAGRGGIDVGGADLGLLQVFLGGDRRESSLAYVGEGVEEGTKSKVIVMGVNERLTAAPSSLRVRAKPKLTDFARTIGIGVGATITGGSDMALLRQ
jgi:hypothetical protein